jgi:glycosyltransferase involved in cell wall biosynthesis
MNYPRISIITPSLNQGKYLETCIQSVLRQDYPHVEHIVMDGGSDDETLDILKKYPHLRWCSEPDKGQAHAINKGVAMAQGELVAWLNCDDAYKPGAFFAIANSAAKTSQQTVLMGGVELYYEDEFLRVMKNRVRSFFRFLHPWIPYTNISQPGVFIPRDLLKAVGLLNEELYYVMDFDLICRLLREKIRFYCVDQVVARYNIHQGSKTGRGWHYMYPELDQVLLDYMHWHNGLKKRLLLMSFQILRPSLRCLYRLLYPPIY